MPLDCFYVRTQSDYNDHYIISKEEVLKQLENAELFVKKVEDFLTKEYPGKITCCHPPLSNAGS